jgi:hypothetical protein
MKQAERSPMRSLNFLIGPDPSSLTMVRESTQLVTEISTKNLLVGNGRPAHKCDTHSRL